MEVSITGGGGGIIPFSVHFLSEKNADFPGEEKSTSIRQKLIHKKKKQIEGPISILTVVH